MSDAEREKAVARTEGLLRALIGYLNITVIQTTCERCIGTGKWQDGGACAHCDGGGIDFTLLGGA